MLCGDLNLFLDILRTRQLPDIAPPLLSANIFRTDKGHGKM